MTVEGEAATIASPASARRRFRRSTPNRYAARHRTTTRLTRREPYQSANITTLRRRSAAALHR